MSAYWLRISLHGPSFPGGFTWETLAPFEYSLDVARADALRGLAENPNATHAVIERPDGRGWRTVETSDGRQQECLK